MIIVTWTGTTLSAQTFGHYLEERSLADIGVSTWTNS